MLLRLVEKLVAVGLAAAEDGCSHLLSTSLLAAPQERRHLKILSCAADGRGARRSLAASTSRGTIAGARWRPPPLAPPPTPTSVDGIRAGAMK
jgi:hypothetical protein